MSRTSEGPVAAPRVAFGRLVVIVDLLVLVLIVAIVAWEPRAGGEGFWYFVVIGGALSLVWVVVGSLLVAREPRNAIGWLVLTIGFAFGVWGLCSVLGAALVFRGIGSTTGVWLAWLASVPVGLLVFLPFLFLLFPTGRVLSPAWRIVAWVLAAGGLVTIAAFALTPDPTLNTLYDVGITAPNPAGVTALRDVGGGIAFSGVLVVLVMGLLAVLSLVLRFRRAAGEERQQIRWLAFVGGAAAILLIVQILTALVGTVLGIGGDSAIEAVFFVTFLLFVASLAIGIPLATGVAILKYHLYDLDVVVKKTVQYAILVVVFGILATVIVIAIPTVVVGLGGSDVVRVAILAAIIAAVLTWIRGPARRLADRIVYGRRATPYEVLAEFSDRLGETYAAQDVLPRMATVLGEGAGAQSATVWLRIGGNLRPEAIWPTGGEPPRSLPDDAVEVVHQGEALGALSVAMPPDDPMTPTKERLVRDLAAQAGLVLRNVRLIEELRGSRRRLVAAQDDERRRIERNIHDGAQQQLVALGVQLKLADGLVERDPAKARTLLASLQASTNDALEDLRDLARGIYPPLLADRGLVAAIEAQARKATTPTTVEAQGVGRYPQDVESAVYFCCLEAMNNVAKYAEASRAAIELSGSNGTVGFRIRDDGRGFDPEAIERGTGLQGMADRLDAIGGTLLIESHPGQGTIVTGRVPADREAHRT